MMERLESCSQQPADKCADCTTEFLLNNTHSLLHTLPWHTKLHGFESGMERTSRLATYLVEDWFTTTHVNQTLKVLCRMVSTDRDGSIAIQDVTFMDCLWIAFLQHNEVDYMKEQWFTAVCLCNVWSDFLQVHMLIFAPSTK